MKRASSSTHMLVASAATNRPTAKMTNPNVIGWIGP